MKQKPIEVQIRRREWRWFGQRRKEIATLL